MHTIALIRVGFVSINVRCKFCGGVPHYDLVSNSPDAVIFLCDTCTKEIRQVLKDSYLLPS